MRNIWDEQDKLKEREKMNAYERFIDTDGFLKMKFKSIIEPKFKFVEVPEFSNTYYQENLLYN